MTKPILGWPWHTDRKIKLLSFRVSIPSDHLSFGQWKISRRASFVLYLLWKYLAPISKEIAVATFLLLSESLRKTNLGGDLLGCSSFCLFISSQNLETPSSSSLGMIWASPKPADSSHQKVSSHLSKLPSREQCWWACNYMTYDFIVYDETSNNKPGMQ